MAPAGTPKAIVDKLNAEINKAIERPDVKEAWAKQGAVPMVMTPGRVRQVPARRHREVGQGGRGRRHQGELTRDGPCDGLTLWADTILGGGAAQGGPYWRLNDTADWGV